MKRLFLILAVLCVCMAPVVTISEPSADQQQKNLYNSSRMQRSNYAEIATEQKVAVVVLKLAPGVDQPGDYAALKTAVEAITGIQNVELMVDGQAPATIPADHHMRLYVTVHPRIHADPEPEPE